VLHLFHAELEPQDEGAQTQLLQQQAANGGANGSRLQYEHETVAGAAAIAQAGAGNGAAAGGPAPAAVQTVQASPHEKLGRNDPCWCGSGKKFKKCHGA
jgi:preprotein translocase subunit SecA